MIILPNQGLWNDIEEYCKILDGLVVQPLESETKFSILQSLPLSKTKYEEIKHEIENHILQLFDKVNAVDKLSIALFIFRTVMKNKMYDDNFADWSPRFIICNYLFYMSLKYLKNSKRTLYVAFNDRLTVEKIFFAGYTILENERLFNEQYFSDNKNLTDEFFERVDKVSNRRGDLHSYQIKNSDLQKYLEVKNFNIDEIRKNALSKYKGQYLSKSELLHNASWRKMISHDRVSNSKDDIMIIPTYVFNNYDEQFKGFITIFESKKCLNPSDSESELIFAYKRDDYVYISKKILSDTQTAIEDFIAWGQYENITQYFLGKSIDQKALRDYNRLMTYKIADLLLTHGYITPMETFKGLPIPRIEISNYLVDKSLKNKLGDIDLMFYSVYTKTLYLIEYKNYQMMVSREGDLSSEVSKVSREDTPAKVYRRHRYVCDNIEYCIKLLFKKKYEISGIKSIILTTKPCFYFYLNKSENYEYMEWIEFENKIEGKEL